MSNVIQFPMTSGEGKRGHVGAAFLENPSEHAHAVQFFEDDEFLCDTVGHFLASGLQGTDRIVVIATKEHREGFLARLKSFGAEQAIESRRFILLDARETLAKFMVGPMPDPDLFRVAIGRMINQTKDDYPASRLRAYGEMVDLLWRDGNSAAAIRLEELWNDAGKEHDFSLLCAYTMGNFYNEGDQAKFFEVCRNHSHVLPTEQFVQIDDANARLREISLLQQRAHALESEIAHRKQLEAALRDALRDRNRAEDDLRACVKREQEARAKAEASDAFKEVFLGILGHDLRNPLNTVLTTVRLMAMRGDLPADANQRLARVITSGVRMQRMVEQLLDVTRARLATGIPVELGRHDMLPLLKKITDEIRVAHPQRAIEVDAPEHCVGHIDPDRFEQVMSNLLGNAVTHGDPSKPIRVQLCARDQAVTFAVHNHGEPIPDALTPLLFDPFKRGEKPIGRAEGLGLGLYISERIVTAHGGRIDVASSADTGTRFEVILPTHG